SIFSTASHIGFQTALIQKKENAEQYFNTVWTIEVLRCFLLSIFVFLIAPLAAGFFKNPEAMRMIRVLSLVFILAGARNIGIINFAKELQFHKQFLYYFITTIIDMVVSVTCAFLLRNAWALVFGLLAGSISSLVLSYVLCTYRPRFEFDLNKAKGLFGFGLWIWGSNILVFLSTQGDDILVGRLLGAVSLGFYQMAYRISNTPATDITNVISQVTFPAYSKFQDNIPRLRESFIRVLSHTVFFTFPLAAFIGVLANDFTRIFLGTKWMPIVLPVQILVIAGLLRSLVATTGPIFYAVGKPKVDTRWQTARLIVLAVLIYPCIIRWGLIGASAAVLASTLIMTMGFGREVAKIIEFRLWGLFKILLFPFLSSLMAVAAIQVCKGVFGNIDILRFMILSVIGVATILGSSYLFYKLFGDRGLLSIRDLLVNLRGERRA
ncbi:MAG: lipopolysaccharide biosynthesis protein, partial [Candidatus Omnitrophota bacterium]